MIFNAAVAKFGGAGCTPVIQVTLLTAGSLSGIPVTASKSGKRIQKKTNSAGSCALPVPEFGTWTVSADLLPEPKQAEVDVSEVKIYELSILNAHVYGVHWDGSSSSALTRTDDAAAFSSPTAAVGTGSASSPFDTRYPWRDMEEYNFINGKLSSKRGQSGFSRKAYDTMVYIPEFWYQRPDVNTFKIADYPLDGFQKHPGSGRYVGRYHTTADNCSKSGAAPAASVAPPTARASASAKGAGWALFDYAAWCAIGMLYLVEFADWDSKTKIGKGNSSGTSYLDSGKTDSMSRHTGRASGTDGKTSVQYRHIENLWGNMQNLLDGIISSDFVPYVCTAPRYYSSSLTSQYHSSELVLPYEVNGANIIALGLSAAFPWGFFPASTNAAIGSGYTVSALYSRTGTNLVQAGGYRAMSAASNLFSFFANIAADAGSGTTGSRLMFCPD